MTIKTPFGNAVITKKGYPRLTSGPNRDKYVHRVSFEAVAQRPVREGFHVHHMGPKTCWCPGMLLEIQPELHPAAQPMRHPYTGRFLSAGEREDWV